MSVEFINSEDDMQWLYDVHLLGMDANRVFRSAVIYGNEDSPDRIELFEDANPTVNDIPRIIIPTNNEEG